MIIDKILEKAGLKFEELRPDERETLFTWMDALRKNQLTLEGVKIYISSMRDSVEQALTKTDHNSKQDLFLKARLKNYMLLEAFLSTPERAKLALEREISGIMSNRGAK